MRCIPARRSPLLPALLAFLALANHQGLAQEEPPVPPDALSETEVPDPPEPQPEPIPDQPPPEAGINYPPPAGQHVPPRRRPSRLPEEERRLLDTHRENAARGASSRKAAAKPSPQKAASKGTTGKPEGKLNVDYVDEPILDVLRAIATAFGLSIIPEKDLGDVKVTIHLENIPVLEGLDKLCKSHGLEFVADGNVYRVRKARETSFSVIEVRNKKMTLDVQNRPVRDFLREFGEKTKINVVAGQDLKGLVTGHLKDVAPVDGFKALMEANNFELRVKNGVYLVENADSSQPMPGGPVSRRRRASSFSGSGSSDVDYHEGRITLSLANASLGDALREIADQAGLNYTIIGDVSGNVNAHLDDVTVDEALSALLQGTRYAFINKGGTLLIGDRNPNTPSGQALSGAELVYLKFIKAENIEKIMPKSVPAENVKVIKEQNAVLISGTVDDIGLVRNFLEKIDVPTPQVLMEVVVVEYNRDKDSEFGVASGRSNNEGGNLNAFGQFSGVKNSFSQGGFEGVIGVLAPKFELNLRALETKNKAKILSMPKVTTLNGNKAELKVSRTSYYNVSSVTKDGFQNNDFRTIDDGITIELTPWVTKHGEVNVSINPSIKTTEVGTSGGPPPVTNRSITTNVRLQDGETIALGGLINSKEDNKREFVPILGSIPFLGYLFSWRKLHTFTTELVIYVTPHILMPDKQAVNLEDEFEQLDRRSGFLKNSDFLKSSKDRLIDGSIQDTLPASEPAPGETPVPAADSLQAR
jgi:type IV pilus assembly protein PilQ